MRVLQGPFTENGTAEKAGPRVVALGTFDGVHRGHQELIRRGRRMAERMGARLRVCVFDRHPLAVLCPEKAPQMLQTAEEQRERIEFLGAEELRVIPFTAETAALEPGAFLRTLGTECVLRGVVTGWNYTFGRGGAGNPELLREKGREDGFLVEVVPPVRTESGEIISSSAVRELLRRGAVREAEEMLGFPYEISGRVVSGKHQGTRIGFPTANIETTAEKLLPRYGVYACRMESEGRAWNALVNIGLQPTIPSGRVTVEAHALGAEVDLYGRPARVKLLEFLRPERRFDSVEALIAQIEQDRENAGAFFREWGTNTLSEAKK